MVSPYYRVIWQNVMEYTDNIYYYLDNRAHISGSGKFDDAWPGRSMGCFTLLGDGTQQPY